MGRGYKFLVFKVQVPRHPVADFLFFFLFFFFFLLAPLLLPVGVQPPVWREVGDELPQELRTIVIVIVAVVVVVAVAAIIVVVVADAVFIRGLLFAGIVVVVVGVVPAAA